MSRWNRGLGVKHYMVKKPQSKKADGVKITWLLCLMVGTQGGGHVWLRALLLPWLQTPSYVPRTSIYIISLNLHNRTMCVFSPTFHINRKNETQ